MTAAVCPTCGSSRHIECCSRCASPVRYSRRMTGFCTQRCADEQARENRASAETERDAEFVGMTVSGVAP